MLRHVVIAPVLNGYIVTIGCQKVVFNNRARMLDELNEYLKNPEAVEARYREEAINAKYTLADDPTGPSIAIAESD